MNKKKGIIIAAAVAVVLAAVVLVLVLVPKGGKNESDKATFDEGISLTRSVDADGVHQAAVNLDENGEIAHNGHGTLMEYYPADIKSIHVENKKGTFDVVSNTPNGKATVYTIKGYEEFDLQAGSPDMIASAAAKLEFAKVASLDKSKESDYGFDKPRSTVTVNYSDSTRAIIIVGDDAPQQAGTYIKFGTGDAVYVASTDTVAAFDYGVTDLISLTITKAGDSAENNQASSIKLSGGGFPKDIELVPNTNDNYSASYMMTAPESRFANESETSLVAGGIRGLYAQAVKAVNPSDAQLREFGLSKPNARLSAVYPDTTIELIASKPDGDGNVNLMVSGKKVVYQITADKAAWAKTSFDKLCYEYALCPKMAQLSEMSVETGGKTYDFELKTHESLTTDKQGSETSSTVTVVKYNGREIELGDFTAFYDAASLIGMSDVKSESGSGSEALRITYTFADGSSDSVAFESSGGAYTAKVNGKAIGHSAKTDIAHAQKALSELVKNI